MYFDICVRSHVAPKVERERTRTKRRKTNNNKIKVTEFRVNRIKNNLSFIDFFCGDLDDCNWQLEQVYNAVYNFHVKASYNRVLARVFSAIEID